MKEVILNSSAYKEFLNTLIKRIEDTRFQVACTINNATQILYWELGKEIVERQKKENWGDAIVEAIAKDLQSKFPGRKGFSARNIWRMRQFYLAYSKFTILPQPVAEIPWGQNILLLEKIKNETERLWYAEKTYENGWSRAVLWHQIDTKLYKRQAVNKKTTNFPSTLPSPQSEMAQEIIKDPYNFDFFIIDENAKEKLLHNALITHVQKFLLELGVGFAFVGSHYPIKVGNKPRELDLLFYHLKLRSYIILELKSVEFEPEHIGKMQYYLTAVDTQLKREDDNPSIGIILCKHKNSIEVEYALRQSNSPIGVSEYRLTRKLPQELSDSLPDTKKLEEEILKELDYKSE